MIVVWMEAFLLEYITFFIAKNGGSYTFSNEYHPFPYTFSSESNAYHTKVLCFYDRFSIIKHPLGNKNYTANHRNPKKTTTFAFNKRSVTYLRKCPIIQYLVSDSGHSTKGLKRDGTTRICKAMKYNDLHLSIHSVYLSKQRLYRLKWMVADNQWCKYAASGSDS